MVGVASEKPVVLVVDVDGLSGVAWVFRRLRDILVLFQARPGQAVILLSGKSN